VARAGGIKPGGKRAHCPTTPTFPHTQRQSSFRPQGGLRFHVSFASRTVLRTLDESDFQISPPLSFSFLHPLGLRNEDVHSTSTFPYRSPLPHSVRTRSRLRIHFRCRRKQHRGGDSEWEKCLLADPTGHLPRSDPWCYEPVRKLRYGCPQRCFGRRRDAWQ